MCEQPFFSVIIAARNEEKNLKKIIPILLSQDYSQFEIIVSLNCSSDGSYDYLNSISNKRLRWINIETIPNGWNAKKFALTEAISIGKGEWLALTDADCLPHPSWLTAIAREITPQTSLLIGYSPYSSNGSFLQDYIQYEAFVTAFLFLSAATTGDPYMAVGRNLAVRKRYFQEVDGYHSFRHIQGGDDDLFIQKFASSENCRPFWGLCTLVETYPKDSLKSYFVQKVRHLSVSKRYRGLDQLKLSLFHVTHLLVWCLLPFFMTSTFSVLFLLYLAIKWSSFRFVGLILGQGINYFRFPVVDMIYSIALPVIGMVARVSKNVKWKI